MDGPQDRRGGSFLVGATPLLTVDLDLDNSRLDLVGELDQRTAHIFHDAISALLFSGRPVWLIDVSQLTRCDRIGLQAIGRAYRRSLRHDRRMAVSGAPPWLGDALNRLRLGSHLLNDAGSPSSPTGLPGADGQQNAREPGPPMG